MTSPFASRVWRPVRTLPVLLPVSAPIAQADTSALQWLQRIYAATEKLSYSGTFIYQQGQQFETSRITHVVEASVPRERLETLDGVPREIIRTGDEIERVGGYRCQVLALEPKDRMRYGHRLWADLSTGMLLKAKTFDEKNELVEQFAFTQLKIGGPIGRDQLKARYLRESRDWRVEDSGATRANLAEAGWTIRSSPAGFRTVAELIRTMGGTGGVGHIVLSDGLAAISVFIEPATSRQPAPQPGLVRQGAINVYMRPVGSHWVTVVGEAPAESVKYIANAVEYRK